MQSRLPAHLLLPVAAILVLSTHMPAIAETPPYAIVNLHLPPQTVLPASIHVNLTDIAGALGLDSVIGHTPVCYIQTEGQRGPRVTTQFDPSVAFDARDHAVGTLTFDLPENASRETTLRLYLPKEDAAHIEPPGDATPITIRDSDNVVTVQNEYYKIAHNPNVDSGLPARFKFTDTGKVFKEFRWNDRVYDRQLKGFYLRESIEPQLKVISRGPLRAVVRLHLNYGRATERPESRPSAVYDFIYYADSPFIRVTAHCKQNSSYEWRELHFIEINFPDKQFTHFATAETPQPQPLKAKKETHRGKWGALIDAQNTLGLVTPSSRIYDGRGSYGTYLHGPWVRWPTTERQFAVHLFVSGTDNSLSQLKNAAGKLPMTTRASITTPTLIRLNDIVQKLAAKLPDGPRRQSALWALALINRTAHSGHNLRKAIPAIKQLRHIIKTQKSDPLAAAEHCLPDGHKLHTIHNAHIGMAFIETEDGVISPHSLFDIHTQREYLAATDAGDMFRVRLSGPDDKQITVSGTDKWKRTEVHVSESTDGDAKSALKFRFTHHQQQDAAENLAVSATVTINERRTFWKAHAENTSDKWSIRKVEFPCIRARALRQGEDRLFVPKASGQLLTSPLTDKKGFNGLYPSGWCSMQFGGYYDDAGGLYFAAHDPLASRKDIALKNDRNAVRLEIGWYAENMTVAGNDFQHPGQCTLAPIHGDWYDAAQIYKSWARQNAEWWPPGGQLRPHTPQWMKEISMWALMSGKPKNVVEPCIKLREYVGVPTAVHWYSWHKIPFDDDYPHYFPTKKGFADAVQKLHDNGVRVMPYINGRLWDTDTDDFDTVGFPAAAKTEDGENYVETYGSGEKLAPMCPTTDTWQNKVQDIVLRLVGDEYNVDGVYIDQIGAARPRLCFDKSHGHPLGGGHWWCTDGYWPLLSSLQKHLPKGKMITTECNAEAYCRWMDGYLSWHFQHQDQIPLFAAVYGGNVQIFSRKYRGNDPLAYRMKAAQALVFGEQIGWLNANYVLNHQKVQGPFFRRIARLRYHLLPYLSTGRMARPPKISGDIPQVTADWAWRDEWPITDTALQSGAWKADDGSLALVFVNSTGDPLSAKCNFDPTIYGFRKNAQLSWMRITENGTGKTLNPPSNNTLPIKLSPYGAFALKVVAR